MSADRIDRVLLEVRTRDGDVVGFDTPVDTRVELAAAITKLATLMDEALAERGLWAEPEPACCCPSIVRRGDRLWCLEHGDVTDRLGDLELRLPANVPWGDDRSAR